MSIVKMFICDWKLWRKSLNGVLIFSARELDPDKKYKRKQETHTHTHSEHMCLSALINLMEATVIKASWLQVIFICSQGTSLLKAMKPDMCVYCSVPELPIPQQWALRGTHSFQASPYLRLVLGVETGYHLPWRESQEPAESLHTHW